MELLVMKNVLDDNRRQADENRRSFAEKGILAVNVMASPGAGKTSLISRALEALSTRAKAYVIEGDIASCLDAERIEAMGVAVAQVNTEGGCHLDASMVSASVERMSVAPGSLLFIENVGNLVCPSAFDLGEGLKLLVSSVPEGDDKPCKYVPMFEAADAIVLNKIDLLRHVAFRKDFFYEGIRTVNRRAPVFELSCSSGEGLGAFMAWLSGAAIRAAAKAEGRDEDHGKD